MVIYGDIILKIKKIVIHLERAVYGGVDLKEKGSLWASVTEMVKRYEREPNRRKGGVKEE